MKMHVLLNGMDLSAYKAFFERQNHDLVVRRV